MHASSRIHLIQSIERTATFDLSLEKFRVTVADAYCYYVALGQARAPGALHFIALLDADESHKLKNRVKYSYEKLLKTVGRRFTEYPRADLEAYFLSPLMGQWPKLVRKSQSKNPEVPTAPLAPALEEVSTQVAVPAEESSGTVATATAAAELEMTTSSEPAIAAAPAACADAAEEDLAEFENGSLVNVRGISAPGNPGYRSFGMPSAHVVEYRGGGVYLVSQAVATPELPYGSRRRVFAHQLTRLKQTKTVGDSVNERSGNKSVSLVTHKKGLVEAQEASRVAEKKATRTPFE